MKVRQPEGGHTVFELLLLVGEFFISLTNSRFHRSMIRISLKCLKVKFDGRVLELFGFEDEILCARKRRSVHCRRPTKLKERSAHLVFESEFDSFSHNFLHVLRNVISFSLSSVPPLILHFAVQLLSSNVCA